MLGLFGIVGAILAGLVADSMIGGLSGKSDDHPDDAAPAFADFLEELVMPDAVAGFLLVCSGDRPGRCRRNQQALRTVMRGQESGDFCQEGRVVAAGRGEKGRALSNRVLKCRGEEGFVTRGRTIHDGWTRTISPSGKGVSDADLEPFWRRHRA